MHKEQITEQITEQTAKYLQTATVVGRKALAKSAPVLNKLAEGSYAMSQKLAETTAQLDDTTPNRFSKIKRTSLVVAGIGASIAATRLARNSQTETAQPELQSVATYPEEQAVAPTPVPETTDATTPLPY